MGRCRNIYNRKYTPGSQQLVRWIAREAGVAVVASQIADCVGVGLDSLIGGENVHDQNSEKNEPQQGGESTAKMTPEEIKGLLEAIQRAEEKTAEKVTAIKAKGKKKSGEKDW